MKYLIFASSVLMALGAAAQNNVTIEAIGGDVLYRGFSNKVTIDARGYTTTDISLSGTNVAITQDVETGAYIVKPTNGSKMTTLHVIALDGAKYDTLTSAYFDIKNLPAPSVYWGEQESGGIADLTSNLLSIRYDAGVTLPNEFEIVQWEMSCNEKTIHGVGSDVSNAQAILKKATTGSVANFLLTVLSSDGIMRKVSAQWVVRP